MVVLAQMVVRELLAILMGNSPEAEVADTSTNLVAIALVMYRAVEEVAGLTIRLHLMSLKLCT
jgi:hypothetical protein